MKIYFPDNGIEASAGEGDTLLDAIRAAGLPIEAVCSGRGTCGKCRVRVNGTEGLACRTAAADGMSVEILSSSEGQEILTDSGAAGKAGAPDGKAGAPDGKAGAPDGKAVAPDGSGAADGSGGAGGAGSRSGRMAIAIDIGTTTVVVKAVDTGSGEEVGVRAFTNPQRVYGADVLSRINNAMDDASMLSGIIKEAVGNAICDILRAEGAGCPGPGKIVVAGNTTMMYLLLNLRCRSLGLAPFEPEFAFSPAYDYAGVFQTKGDGSSVFKTKGDGSSVLPDGLASCPVLIYPYISAYVGGDIVSGLVNIERHLETGASPSYILVDMGTNGEIAYRNGERLITTSTAAGPALEGGNIACGMSGLPGAISEASYMGDGRFSYKTIGDKPAAGICGSGVISLMAALLDAGLVSASGAFTDEADRFAEDADEGPARKQLVIAEADGGGARVVFTQKDVREFQLAKGAIRAGIDILAEEMGELPAALYLAGGFGQNISLESAFRVGLIPRGLGGRIRFAGNTSLGGCVDACVDGGADAPLPSLAIIAAAREINLGSHKSFNDKFMDTMMFEE